MAQVTQGPNCTELNWSPPVALQATMNGIGGDNVECVTGMGLEVEGMSRQQRYRIKLKGM